MRSLPRNLKANLTRFLPVICAIAVCFAWPLVQQVGATQQQVTPPNAAKSAPVSSPPVKSEAATKVVADAIEGLEKYSSIKADLRESVVMGTRRFVATGKYTQGSDNQLRLTLEIQPIEETASVSTDGKKKATRKKKTAASEPSSVTQVSDGRMLWTEWKTNDTARVERRDLQEIAKAVEGDQRWQSPEQLMADLGLGGVPALLTSLQKRMVFQGVRDQEVDGKPFVVVQGRWSEEQLKRFNAQDPDPILPPHVPEYVRVFFEKKTMFPRRIMFLKRHPVPQQRLARPMVTLDLTNVELNGPVDPDLFRFAGDSKNQNDTTEDFIKALKQQPAPPQQPAGSAGQ
ncbi:MAG: hypothetical protein AB8G99_19365 [Planctomycetaceae bacterium]